MFSVVAMSAKFFWFLLTLFLSKEYNFIPLITETNISQDFVNLKALYYTDHTSETRDIAISVYQKQRKRHYYKRYFTLIENIKLKYVEP